MTTSLGFATPAFREPTDSPLKLRSSENPVFLFRQLQHHVRARSGEGDEVNVPLGADSSSFIDCRFDRDPQQSARFLPV